MPLYRIEDLEKSSAPGSLLMTDQNGEPFYSVLEAKTLVSPTISVTWSAYQNDGLTNYVNHISNSKNLVTETGCKVGVSATYQYPVPSTSETVPSSASGSWGPIYPLPGVASHVFDNSGIKINGDNSYSVNLIKPKTGLIVVNEQVVAATGNNVTSDQISITFMYCSYFGFSSSTELVASEIKALGNKTLQPNRGRTVENVSAGSTEYTYYCYPALMGSIVNIIQSDSLPIPDAFTRLSDVVITTDAGIDVSMAVYKSNATNAFTNVKLVFS